jgi:hypothetical protein
MSEQEQKRDEPWRCCDGYAKGYEAGQRDERARAAGIAAIRQEPEK